MREDKRRSRNSARSTVSTRSVAEDRSDSSPDSVHSSQQDVQRFEAIARRSSSRHSSETSIPLDRAPLSQSTRSARTAVSKGIGERQSPRSKPVRTRSLSGSDYTATTGRMSTKATSKHNARSSKSEASKISDTNSNHSEDLTITEPRLMERRTRPSSRLLQDQVPHNDQSELDSLSLHSSFDTRSSISGVADTAAALASFHNIHDHASRHSEELTKAAIQAIKDSYEYSGAGSAVSEDLAIHTLERDEPSGSTSIGTSSYVDHPDTTIESAAKYGDEIYAVTRPFDGAVALGAIGEETKHVGTSEAGVLAASEVSPGRLSSSSFSSDLSELSSHNSVGSVESHESVSSSGSKMIKRLEDLTDLEHEEERQVVVVQALALCKKWKDSWMAMERRMQANHRKRERSRAVRRQAQAAASGKRRRV